MTRQNSSKCAALAGVLPILPTIFTDSGVVDEAATRGVLDYVVDAGASSIAFPGLSSEYDMLTMNERLHLTAQVGRFCRINFFERAFHTIRSVSLKKQYF